ncbi:hypothetical protein BDV95DRAFT_506111 [Massariosphaeria phaeospora]|uniref:Uncharacterized protein n=1 Tax=Massariosphaeria phaeospora TaxID=100035 RepID=A0A7C8M2B6_9PLEO|nr:hypothetical protein BDV95DRAFT_506111 [Massariosphaeria phaeospora]
MGVPVKHVRKTAKSKQKHVKPSSAWTLSEPFGGWFITHDPLFSQDEKSLMLANARALQIYSTETSLLTAELLVGTYGVLLAYALSSTNPNHVYVADSNGLITLWNWVASKKIGRWDIGAKIQQLAVVTQPESKQDLVYCYEAGDHHILNIHALFGGDQASKTDLKMILKINSPIKSIQVFLHGKLVVVTCANSIIIGKRSKIHKTELQDFVYVWREFKTSKGITASSAFVRISERFDTGKQPSQDQKDHVDLAIGDETGLILLFEDVLASFAAIEKSKKDAKNKSVDVESFKPKHLHWHREAVGSLKWSLDGNYLISGGDETVLVIWQLSTGKQQHLPHLTAAIENIVVSPSGASYALTLANNSVIVLSTSELIAKSNVIGIQSRRIDVEQLPRVSNATFSFERFSPIPMVVDPKNSSLLIYTVPSSQPRHPKFTLHPEPYIQTYDFTTFRPVSRQALTRNNATDPNMGPEGRRIQEPSVKFLQTSYDGKWLATVDEWVPPKADMGYLDEGMSESNEEERVYRREVYLKFWEWDEQNGQWSLGTRVDAPHYFEDIGACGRVLDLVFDPSSQGFATVGEDRSVRIWRPKTRLKDGVTVRGANNSSQGLVTWSLERSVEISSKLDVLDTTTDTRDLLVPQNSCLAFSADGSVLAVGMSWASESDPGVVHIIDTENGTVRRSITELDVSALSALIIVGRHLVVTGGSIAVWDLVLDQLVHCISIDTPGISVSDRAPVVRLAANEYAGTFAISCPQFEQNTSSKSRGSRHLKKTTSKVSIYDPNQSGPVWSCKVAGVVLALASERGGKGYVVLDSSSSVRLVSAKVDPLQLITPPPESRPKGTTEPVEDWDQDEPPNSVAIFDDSEELIRHSENDKPVVRPEQLQEIFAIAPSHALPPVKDLFNAVVRLYARKPRVISAV